MLKKKRRRSARQMRDAVAVEVVKLSGLIKIITKTVWDVLLLLFSSQSSAKW